MKRGEIYYANLDPTIGSEIKKKRPVLLVSNNANNQASSTVTIVPLTSNVSKVYPFEVFIEHDGAGLQKPSKVQCHQIRTISKLRISGDAIGKASTATMGKVNAAIKLHLGLT